MNDDILPRLIVAETGLAAINARLSEALVARDKAIELDQRYSVLRTLVEANDRLYRERWDTAEKMTTAAMVAADAKWLAADQAVASALAASDKRLDGMNEFRATLADQAASFVNRDEYNVAHKAISDNVVRIELQSAQYPSKDETLANFQRIEERMKLVESKLSNWDGRLWAIGTMFLVMNFVVSWLFSGHWSAH